MFRHSSSPSPKPAAAPHFPIYLLPGLKIPFLRRRQSSATNTSTNTDVPSLSSSPTSATTIDDLPSSPTGISAVETYTYELPDDKPPSKSPQRPKVHRDPTHDRLARVQPDILRCNTCGTDIAYGLQVVSRGFTGRHGRALLVSPPLSTPTPSCPGSPLPPSNNVISPDSGYSSLARDGANLVNTTVGRPEPRNLATGAHVVADINCSTCKVKIGWKYVDAREPAQKYKVGKFILEIERVVTFRSWEDVLPGEVETHGHFYSSSAPACSFGGRRKSSVSGGTRKASCSSETEEEPEDSTGGSEEGVVFNSDDEDECEDIFAGTWDAATVAQRRGSKVSGGSRKGTAGNNRIPTSAR